MTKKAMTLSDIAPTLTGEPIATGYTDAGERPSRDEIARFAYHLYETQGRQDGHDVDNWLSAERELTLHAADEHPTNHDHIIDLNESARRDVVTRQRVHRS